jgi:PAS domain S-box-containing protein
MLHNLGIKAKAILLALILTVIIALAIGMLAWQMLQHTRSELDQRLHSALDSSITQVKQEIDKHKALVRYWADSADLIFAALVHLQDKPRSHRADSVDLLDELLLASLEQLNYRDYKIISQEGVVLASGSGHDRGDTLPRELAHNISLAWNGFAQVSRPFKATRAWTDVDGWIVEGLTSMLSLAAIVDNRGNTVALLAFEIDPDVIFNPLFHHSWMGETGESYGINSDGILLTHIKYTQQLIDIGLLEDNTSVHPALTLKMTDPGYNLVKNPTDITKVQSERPLTVMAQSLSVGGQGSNVTGYADYRGVPVIGAWRWDDELQMGIVTEVDVEEAFYLYNSILRTMPLGLLITVLIVFSATILYLRANRKTHRIQQQRDALFKQTIDGIITIDNRGLVLVANPAASKIFGYKNEEMIGQNISLLMAEEERVAHDVYLRESQLHEEKVFNLTRDLQGRRKNGEIFPLELTISPMIVENEKFYIGVLRDVTQRYQQQQDLITAKEHAETAQEIAEHANRAKSEFLSKMSHELRTPLNAILGFSQLLSADSLTTDQLDSVNLINNSGKHLLNLINDVLDLARIESGNVVASLEHVNIGDLITEITPVIETQLDELQLTLTTNYFTDQEIWVIADYIRLKQVLLNLLSNAVKYNRTLGTITIDVRFHSSHTIRIAVQDSGYGIDAALLEGLFEPFNRLGKDASAIQGTGIGLVISRELIRLMHGELGVSSIVDTGSVFWLDLPLAETKENDEITDTDELLRKQEQRLAEDEKVVTVLYIEDNPANMMLVRQLFVRFPLYQLLEAETAELGLDIAREQLPDIILMDINLPDMNGFEALTILQQEGLTKKMKIVALSANALVSEVKRGYDAGFDYYLTKPVEFKKLLETLHDVYEQKNNEV